MAARPAGARRRTAGILLASLLLASSAAAQARGRARQQRLPPLPPVQLEPTTPPRELPPIYLPGYEPQATSVKERPRGQAPAGPKSKPQGRAPAPAPQEDPMKAADEVTAQADRRSELEESELAWLADHFGICDLDANGWLSLREAETTLSLDRGEFRRVDGNADGRLELEEFTAARRVLLARLGALPELPRRTAKVPRQEPSPESAPEPAPAPEGAGGDEPPPGRPGRSELGTMRVMPGEILRRYDANGSKGIDAPELEKLLREVGLALSTDLVVAQMDPDDSGELEAAELVPIAWLASQHLPEALRSGAAHAREAPGASGGAEGATVPPEEDGARPARRRAARSTVTTTKGTPDRSLTHFGRLDADGDGFVDEADLRRLQSPALLDVRLRAILSALDRDGDGRLTEAEFRASMSDDAS